ncbi:MAG: acyl-CoA dehydrogenase [Candidatus Marinimicrobia bacterium]|nr:acyl-CoA dehydrogenase [Candidatus Neomarinimicrobiota bacterium]MBT3575899.1 acyl-CoA dehydrogenase [Candidatus Neomarinimicrobiota bacterium]MBT3679404.1 acyl-CoA dehydrogenase [Candidatus Neomarinimicrobiota bacterium]MBT3951127.1 acyl-CoA dehydrogenase [Candidatus Neomarinimicrobiota bacterium]MBT4254193.1 acyl-CoA dehydrogenase [Candidatus Neomarinimicrobiota bacterium]
MQKTIQFFETKGLQKVKDDDTNQVWYADFLDFIKKEKIFATLLTPPAHGKDNYRWDTWRIAHFNEILGFYGLAYWYTWQVSILGLGPIWMSENEALKQRAARLLEEGEVFAFGLSEKDHGADIYSTEMSLSPQETGQYLANGSKYYIGNGNIAKMVSTFGKMSDSGDYVVFVANYQHEKYNCVKNVVNSQSYVAEYTLDEYPISEEDILHKGEDAWNAVLNTVNIGKYNLGWASIGMCTHAFYEALSHASQRKLYDVHVTDFSHVQQMFVDGYSRLVAMKLVALRAADYMRVASSEDKRYLLYNPVVKMKVTTQGEAVIDLLWDVIAAKGFEKDTFFEMASRDIRALPKLEGTVHVNIALILKFMASYFFRSTDYPDVEQQSQAQNDDFLFNQGPTRGLGKIRFHDYSKVYKTVQLPNVKIFKQQIRLLKTLLMLAKPDKSQRKDIDFLMALGELFTLVVYGQLVLENAKIYAVDDDTIDQIFDFMVRDFSSHALQLYSKSSATMSQMRLCSMMIKKPTVDRTRFDRVWSDQIFPLKDRYVMKP